MKLNKKTTTIISFAIGTVLFTTTAIAQVITKSGYDQLKDSIKYTAESCTTKPSSYTMDMSFSLKDNKTIISSRNELTKVDSASGARENVSKRVDGAVKAENYFYSDKTISITKSSEQNIYYQTELASPNQIPASINPFKQEGAADMEKIADALVGNLKDAVVVTDNSDGTRTLSGSLSEAQIPALINALVSFQSKRSFGNSYNMERGIPQITKDVFVKEIKGTILTTKEGLVQSVLGSGVISGSDEKGKEHNLTFELLVKMSNINSTKVSKPDLSGKKVEKNIEKKYNKLSSPEKYIGKYKTDILIEKDKKYQKIGEKFVDITKVDDKVISGRYYEEYAKGYEEYATNKKDFKFEGSFEKDQFNGYFTSDSSSNSSIKGNISMNPGSAKIYFSTNENRSGNMIYDDQYSRVFD